MFCESYRRPLTDAAIGGAALPPALGEHLAGCQGCRAAFEAEIALGRSIDRALGSAVNVPVPPALAARVRAAVSAEGGRPLWRPDTAALLGTLALAGLIVWLSSARLAPPAGSPAEARAPAGTEAGALRGAEIPPAPVARRDRLPVRPPLRPRVPRRSEPEVLVAQEEKAGFERYLAQRSQSRENAYLEGDAGRDIKPLEIAAMDLRQLTIEPLQGGDTD